MGTIARTGPALAEWNIRMRALYGPRGRTEFIGVCDPSPGGRLPFPVHATPGDFWRGRARISSPGSLLPGLSSRWHERSRAWPPHVRQETAHDRRRPC
jgi:hypothetical protein